MSSLAPSIASRWRQRLQQDQLALRQAFEQNADTRSLLHNRSRMMDQLLAELWFDTGMPPLLCLAAVGGYGRGELYPQSDIDLLILLPDDHQEAYDHLLEPLIGLFWDIGLAVGHSVRSIQECLDEAASDVTVRTNLLEARWLAGDRQSFGQMQQKLAVQMNPAAFLQAKKLEQQQRHARFNDTAYNLEPNVKESPGGLRDLQNVLWISQAMGIGQHWSQLATAGLISPQEATQIRRHERFLQMLRLRLHYLAGRREDRLLFDFQNELANQLGIQATARRRASERLMQQYYRSAKFVRLMNEILQQSLEERIATGPLIVKTINPRFRSRNGYLEMAEPGLLQREPGAILESFLLLQQRPELKGMGTDLVRHLWRDKTLIDRDFRNDPANKQRFLGILRQPDGITGTMRRMNRFGILGRYIPAFGRISGQMQHDLFHVYTVDEHILNVLRNLRRFTDPQHTHEFPLCSKLIREFEKPELLYLGALFHDIAKGRGGDHSTLGTSDARRFCRSHGLPPNDTALVCWLVQNHLLMSSTAQKLDLSDPGVVQAFADHMHDERHLVALYLLTVADIRGTSPNVWNAWKAKLLENLFSSARRLLRGNRPDSGAEIESRREQATTTLSHYGIRQDSYQQLWQALGFGYFLRHEAQEIAWHTRLLLAHLNATQPIVRARLSPSGDGIQVMIYLRDRANLFANMCSFFERISYTIVEAKVHTTAHGYALDSFLVLDNRDHSIGYRDLMSFIEYELTQQLLRNEPPPTPSQGRISRQLKHFPIKPEINLSRDRDTDNHLLSIVAGDRPGLLSRVAHIFMRHDVELHTAKINTLGNRAEDTFLISGPSGAPLASNLAEQLREELLASF